MKQANFIKRHALPTYFALAFAISWGGFLLVIGGPGGIPGTKEEFETLLPFAIVAMLAGPSVASVLLTLLFNGRTGLRELLSRLLRWRVGARWYAVALLTAPVSMTAVLLALSLFSPEFLPGIYTSDDKTTLLLSGIAVGLVVGLFEELGWTGFAVPRPRRRYGVHRLHAHPRAFGDIRGRPHDLRPRIGHRDLGRRRSGGRGDRANAGQIRWLSHCWTIPERSF